MNEPTPETVSERSAIAAIAQDRITRIRDVFASFHFAVEGLLRQRQNLSDPTGEEIERMASSCLDRTQGLLQEFLNGDDADDEMSVDELTIRAIKVVSEDFLCRIDPILAGDEDPTPIDPAPDTTL